MEITITDHIIRIVVVSPQARIDAFTAPALRETLHQLLDEGVNRFVLDLSNVPFLDSAGLSLLVSLLKRVRQIGGDVKLVWPREEAAQRIFRLTKFDHVFNMTESVQLALQSF